MRPHSGQSWSRGEASESAFVQVVVRRRRYYHRLSCDPRGTRNVIGRAWSGGTDRVDLVGGVILRRDAIFARLNVLNVSVANRPTAVGRPNRRVRSAFADRLLLQEPGCAWHSALARRGRLALTFSGDSDL